MPEIAPYQWVMAPFPVFGDWLYAYYKGKNEAGLYMVEFDIDGPVRLVSEIRPI